MALAVAAGIGAAGADPIFAAGFDRGQGLGTATVYMPDGVYTYTQCAPMISNASGAAWNGGADCTESLAPSANTWIPGSGYTYASRVNLGSGARIRCEVIEFEDNRRAGRWWLLAECV